MVPPGPRLDKSARAQHVRIFGVEIYSSTADTALARIRELATGGVHRLAFVNAHTLNLAYEDDRLRRALADCSLVLNDGIGVALAARMRGVRIEENLNGSDFTSRFLELAAEVGWKVFLLGASPGVAEAAQSVLTERIPGLQVVGTRHGYCLGPSSLEAVRAVRPDVVIAALGQPAQELWLDQNLAETGAFLGLGVGAYLDFTAGRVRRAPRWMNEAGIEWLYRLTQEPQRLWRRYVIGNPQFLRRAWLMRRSDGRSNSVNASRV